MSTTKDGKILLRRRELIVLAGGTAGGCLVPACGAPQKELPPGQCASVLKMPFQAPPEAQKLAVHQTVYVKDYETFIARDERGYMAIWARCQHAGCIVNPNDKERTYDCPCHGSRYEFDGAVKKGPTERPLFHFNMCRENGLITVGARSFLDGIDQRLDP